MLGRKRGEEVGERPFEAPDAAFGADTVIDEGMGFFWKGVYLDTACGTIPSSVKSWAGFGEKKV